MDASSYDDDKKLYDVQELQEYNGDSQFPEPDAKLVINKHEFGWKIPILVGIVAMSFLLLIVILQSVTIAHLNLIPVVCPESTTSATTTTTTGNGGTQANTGACQSDSSYQTILSRLNQVVNMSQNILLLVGDSQSSCSVQNDSFVIDSLSDTSAKLINIISTLAQLKESNAALDGVVNEIFLLSEELLRIHNDTITTTLQSCEDLRTRQPNSPSGYYNIKGVMMYCEMAESLCGSIGGWTRIAYLDMADSTTSCPTNLREYEKDGVRACGRPVSSSPSCASVTFPANNVSYTEVCGRVVGYQYNSPAAVSQGVPNPSSIDSYYVDGVSITKGNPREHVWTLMAGLYDTGSSAHYANCPCNDPSPGSIQVIPSFVGNDYFCESGYDQSNAPFHTHDPLWDGKDCGSHEIPCCSVDGLPWFHKTYTFSSDYLELRVCCDQDTADEDAPVGFYEIYVK